MPQQGLKIKRVKITPKYKKLRGKFPNQPNTPARIKSKIVFISQTNQK